MNERLTLIGGEILEWSDLEPASGPPAMSGQVATPLLRSLLSGNDRVLVVGPHQLELLTAIAEAAAVVDVLVRSARDAGSIAERFPDSKVVCGGLDRLEGPAEYDVVVALDGVSRLFGPDSNDLGWHQAVTVLRNQVKPGGRLLLAVGNSLGLDTLIGARHTGMPTDDAWPRTVDLDPPAGLDRITEALGAAPRYAVYPDEVEPELLVTADLLAGPVDDPLLRATIATAAADPVEAFTDPGRAVRDVVDHGLGLRLAPAWWFLLGEPAELPALVVAEPGADGQPLLLSLDRRDGGWTRRIVGGTPAPWRDLPDSGEIDVPVGPLLEDRLLAACRCDDQELLLRLTAAYVEWLRTVDQPLFAVPDNVVVDERTFAVLDPAWTSPLTPAPDLVAVRNLTRYAVRQLAAGVRSPWPAGSHPEQLVTRLAANAGISCDEAIFEAAAKLDAEIAAGAGPRFATAAETAAPHGLREATATITRLSAELEDLRGQVAWLDVTLSRIRGSRAYRVGGMVLRPASKLKAVTKLRTRRRDGKDA